MDERISRLMDGELDGPEADDLVRELRRPEAVATWACYHIIGDALRGDGAPKSGFARRFAARLDAEPTIVAPRPRSHPAHRLPFVWAAAATVAAVLVVSWVAVSTLDPQATTFAKAREVIAVRGKLARLQPVSPDYLLAHQEFSPTAQIQGVEPYLRAASIEGADGRP